MCAIVLATSTDAEALCPENWLGDEIVNEHADSGQPIFTKFFQLDSQLLYQWRVRYQTPGSNSVMRLFRREDVWTQGYTSSVTEVARGSTSSASSYESEITGFSPEESGYYVLVVHPTWSNTSGIGDLYFNGQLSEASIAFGGQPAYTCRLNAGEKVHTRHEAGGANRHQLLVAKSPTGEGYFFGGDSEGGQGLEYTNQGTSSDDWNVAFVASYDPFSGALSQVWNDANQDDDGDGLGNLLEESVGTCKNHNSGTQLDNGWDCSQFDGRDTDNDGLSDYEELLGISELSCSFLCHYDSLPLRMWGADPTHKDFFVEVDYEQGVLDALGNDPFRTSFADYFKKQEIPDDVLAWYQAGSAADVKNPNGEPGVDLHFDVEQGEDPAFSNNPVMVFDGGGSGLVSNEDCGDYKGRRDDSMTPFRKPHFRYMCARSVGTGKAGGVALKANVVSSSREYFTGHELGHTFGISHGGTDRTNGKPQYKSIMNYAFGSRFGFSDEPGNLLNPVDLCEEYGLGPGVAVDHLAQYPYYYLVNTTDDSVDWNRDGSIAPCSEPVRAPITWAPTTGTGLSSLGKAQEMLRSQQETANGASGHPSLVRTSTGGVERLFLFYSNGEHVRYRRTPFDDGCPKSNPNLGENRCGEWEGPYSGHYAAKSLAAESFVINGNETIVAALNKDNKLRMVEYGVASGGLLISSLIAGDFFHIQGTPSLERIGNELVLVWRDSFGLLRQLTMDNSGNLGTISTIKDASGANWTSNTAPALAIN